VKDERKASNPKSDEKMRFLEKVKNDVPKSVNVPNNSCSLPTKSSEVVK